MAEYDHLPLRRVGETQDRRRRQAFGRQPARDRPAHGNKIIADANAIVREAAEFPDIEGIDPSLILKAVVPGFTNEDDWRRAGLTVVGYGDDSILILFGNDTELSEFRRRAAAYQRGPEGDQENAPYAGFFDALESISFLSAQDRMGSVLRMEGVVRPDQLVSAALYTFDVELWRPEDEFVAVFIRRVLLVVDEFEGELISEYRGAGGILLRIQAAGACFQEILNLKEVASIDRPPKPDIESCLDMNVPLEAAGIVGSPPDDAVCIGIVDSGVNDGHPMLQNVVAGSFGMGALSAADERGHGTQVAGIAAYGNIEERLANREFSPRFKIASARVVDATGNFEDREFIHSLVRAAVIRLNEEFGCRIINISLADHKRITGARASLWAETLDELVRERNIVVIVSAGNSDAPWLISQYGDQIGEAFPGYLCEENNRLFDPAGAVNVVTVGSLAHTNAIVQGDGTEIIPITGLNQPSPFTRSGLGLGGAFKPDLVDYGGSAIFDGLTQRFQDGSTRPSAGIMTLHHRYLERLFSKVSGTSFAAPLIAYKAATILERFPQSSANFIRALLAISSNTPEESAEAFNNLSDDRDAYRIVGHGVPDLREAIYSDDNRVVLTAEDSLEPDKFAVFEIPIPAEFHSTPGRRSIDVSLAFDPAVRRTRRDYAGLAMQFDVVRGASEDDVVAAYSAIDPDEDGPNLTSSQKCSLVPGITIRKSGTLQRARFSMARNVTHYGETYYLVVRCIGKWAREQVDNQGFAVAVMLYHAAEIPLYARIQARLRIAVRP